MSETAQRPKNYWTILETRVARGAKWLDKFDPEWFTKINISKLRISSPEMCICGQLFMGEVKKLTYRKRVPGENGFSWALGHIVGLRGEQNMVAKGMNISDTWSGNASVWPASEYEDLTVLWVEQIEKRLANAGMLIP